MVVAPPVAQLLEFLDASPSPYHAVQSASVRLRSEGWLPTTLIAGQPIPQRGFVSVGGTLIAWELPHGEVTHFRILGAHTDSPNLRIKPRPDTGNVGWRQLGVEIYGGALLNSWLDRDLGLSGRVVLGDGSTTLVRYEQPLARVPQLAIHLDREVTDRGLVLDKQQHLTPIWGLGAPASGQFRDWLADLAKTEPGQILAWDLMLHDLTGAALLGVDGEFIVSGRIDNLVSSWCALEALVSAGPSEPGTARVVCLFDHEEVGSESATGAGGPMLDSVLRSLLTVAGGAMPLGQAALQSACVSADMAHAVHPNYPERHEPNHRPLPNAGPVIKVNANQRYATDARTHAMFAIACQSAGVPWQVFVSKNSQPCGSTIGPITSTRLGIPTVDVGCAQLSMHSARELCGSADPGLMMQAMAAFFDTALPA